MRETEGGINSILPKEGGGAKNNLSNNGGFVK